MSMNNTTTPKCYCGADRVKAGIFYVCTNPECVENPASNAARLDRRATIAAVEADGYAGEELAPDADCDGYDEE